MKWSRVYSGTTKQNNKNLQLIHNFTARVIAGVKKNEHISPALRELNWFPFRDAVQGCSYDV